MIALVLGVMCLLSVDTLAVTVPEKSSESPKTKRYLTHEPTPCPPLPHLHQSVHLPEWTQPHVPTYPKPTYELPMTSHPQLIHQSAPVWTPHPATYAKPQVLQPIHHQPMIHHQPIHQIQPIIKQWNYPQKINYHMPQFSYAPSYQVKKFEYHHTDYLKPVNYHAALKTPGVKYKDGKDCEPCHQSSQHYQPPVQRPYVKPIIHEAPARPASHYLPVPHMQSSLIKQTVYGAPCTK